MDSRQGMILVVSAPSGAGKSTLIGKLRAEFPGIEYSVSHTTRQPRPGEVDGVDYVFLGRERFIESRDAGAYAEWAEVHGNFYGTPKAPVYEKLARGVDVIFDVDVQGAAALRPEFGNAAYVFILPPSFDILAQRLAGRGSDSPETVRRRLDNARGEINRAGEFDYLVVNDDLDTAFAELRSVYMAERLRPGLRPGLTRSILASFSDS